MLELILLQLVFLGLILWSYLSSNYTMPSSFMILSMVVLPIFVRHPVELFGFETNIGRFFNVNAMIMLFLFYHQWGFKLALQKVRDVVVCSVLFLTMIAGIDLFYPNALAAIEAPIKDITTSSVSVSLSFAFSSLFFIYLADKWKTCNFFLRFFCAFSLAQAMSSAIFLLTFPNAWDGHFWDSVSRSLEGLFFKEVLLIFLLPIVYLIIKLCPRVAPKNHREAWTQLRKL